MSDFDISARYRLLVRLPAEQEGHSIDSSDDISEIDSKIEELKYENLPEGTMVYVVEGPKDAFGQDKFGQERSRTRREMGTRVIKRSRIYRVENGDLVRSKWVPWT